MRGTFTFRPCKANLTHDTEWITKMDPYCSFTVGSNKFKSQICKSGGKNPVWSDEIQVPIDTDQQFAYLQLLDQDRLSKDDNIGTATIDLFEVMNNTNRFVSKWYPIFYKNKSAGEILIEIGFQPSGQTFQNQPFVSGTQNISQGYPSGGVGYGQERYTQSGIPSSGLTGQSGLQSGGISGTSGYGSNISGQSGYGQNIPGQSGYGTNISGQSGYGQTIQEQTGIPSSGQSGGLHHAGSVEDPLYGKTVDIKSAGVYSGERGGYTQGQGTNLGQGTSFGQGSLNPNLNPNVGQGTLGQGNLGQQQQFNQPGYY